MTKKYGVAPGLSLGRSSTMLNDYQDISTEEKSDVIETTYDEETLRKVYEALLENGIFGQKATDIVSAIQNKGILFRERPKRRRGRPKGSKNKPKVEENPVPQVDSWSPEVSFMETKPE